MSSNLINKEPMSKATPAKQQTALSQEKNIGWSREQMAQRCAQDIEDSSYVNLGIGIPEKVAQYVPEGREVIYHTENGLLGMGNAPTEEELDPDLINAGKKPVTAIAGASYFHHGDSFAMIRGNHIDVCVLGAMQVSEKGDLANWSTGAADAIPAVGGAMDLVAGVKTIYIITQHTTKTGAAKILPECTFPLTGKGVVNRIYSDLCVIDVTKKGLVLTELAPNISFDYVQARTGVTLLNAIQ
ncbi:MAG: CoA transferase subunit B [Colwellia sp.]|nr:CoA transferase subunit B [Colwellia sp.]